MSCGVYYDVLFSWDEHAHLLLEFKLIVQYYYWSCVYMKMFLEMALSQILDIKEID